MVKCHTEQCFVDLACMGGEGAAGFVFSEFLSLLLLSVFLFLSSEFSLVAAKAHSAARLHDRFGKGIRNNGGKKSASRVVLGIGWRT